VRSYRTLRAREAKAVHKRVGVLQEGAVKVTHNPIGIADTRGGITVVR